MHVNGYETVQVVVHPDKQHSIHLLAKPSVCTKESLRAYKSLDVYNYTLCWIEELFPSWDV